MRARTQYLLRKEHARRLENEARDNFLSRLTSKIPEIGASPIFTSFDDTRELFHHLEKLPKDTELLTQKSFHWSEIVTTIDGLADRVADTMGYVLFVEHYWFMGALRLPMGLALRNLKCFLEIGEETLIVIDEALENHLELDQSEDRNSQTGVEFELEVGGRDWIQSSPNP